MADRGYYGVAWLLFGVSGQLKNRWSSLFLGLNERYFTWLVAWWTRNVFSVSGVPVLWVRNVSGSGNHNGDIGCLAWSLSLKLVFLVAFRSTLIRIDTRLLVNMDQKTLCFYIIRNIGSPGGRFGCWSDRWAWHWYCNTNAKLSDLTNIQIVSLFVIGTYFQVSSLGYFNTQTAKSWTPTRGQMFILTFQLSLSFIHPDSNDIGYSGSIFPLTAELKITFSLRRSAQTFSNGDHVQKNVIFEPVVNNSVSIA